MNDLGIQLNTARYLQIFLLQNNLEQIDIIIYEVE
jgi:hypothetical protein